MPEPGRETDDESEDRSRRRPRQDPELWWWRVRWLLAVIGEGTDLIADSKAAALAAFAARAAVVLGDAFFRS